jgi:hypothetical protein
VGVVTGPSGAGGGRDKGEAEQKLPDEALRKCPHIFTPDRLWAMDRNYPGVLQIKAMLAAGTHVLIRVKDGVTLTRTGDFLPDGSYPAVICGGGQTLDVRVIEYQVSRRARHPGTVLPDHRPGRPPDLPGRDTRGGVPLAVDRVRDRPEGSQVRDPGVRAAGRADAPLRIARPDCPGARPLTPCIRLTEKAGVPSK